MIRCYDLIDLAITCWSARAALWVGWSYAKLLHIYRRAKNNELLKMVIPFVWNFDFWWLKLSVHNSHDCDVSSKYAHGNNVGKEYRICASHHFVSLQYDAYFALYLELNDCRNDVFFNNVLLQQIFISTRKERLVAKPKLSFTIHRIVAAPEYVSVAMISTRWMLRRLRPPCMMSTTSKDAAWSRSPIDAGCTTAKTNKCSSLVTFSASNKNRSLFNNTYMNLQNTKSLTVSSMLIT